MYNLLRKQTKCGASEDKPIIFVTGNKNKLEEAKKILNIEIESKLLDLPEIQSTDVGEVIDAKLDHAKTLIHRGQRLFVEDTSLIIDSIQNIKYKTPFPGALIKFYTKALDDTSICKLHHGSAARAITSIGYIDNTGLKSIFFGSIEGSISDAPRGENGFGWDKIFVPKYLDGAENKLTFAEMSDAQKNSISMRKMALEQLYKHIKK